MMTWYAIESRNDKLPPASATKAPPAIRFVSDVPASFSAPKESSIRRG